MEPLGRFLTMLGAGSLAVNAFMFLIFPNSTQRLLLIIALGVFAAGMVLWGIGLHTRKTKRNGSTR